MGVATRRAVPVGSAERDPKAALLDEADRYRAACDVDAAESIDEVLGVQPRQVRPSPALIPSTEQRGNHLARVAPR